MVKNIIVVSGGFNGICAAYLLSAHGFHVTMIEASSKLGGVINSFEKNGNSYDVGCYLFDNNYPETSAIIKDILDHEITPFEAVNGSILGGVLSDDSCLPNLESLGDNIAQTILFELINLVGQKKSKQNSAENLYDLIRLKFGETAARVLDQAAFKKIQCSTKELSPYSFDIVFSERLFLLDDNAASLLKKIPELDAKISKTTKRRSIKSASNNDIDPAGAYREYYPKNGGLDTFGRKAHKKLTDMGVEILMEKFCVGIEQNDQGYKVALTDKDSKTKTYLNTDAVYWGHDLGILANSLDIPVDLKKYKQVVPQVLYYFNLRKTDIRKYSCLQNFDREVNYFRVSTPCEYAHHNSPESLAYVCVEVPTYFNSDIWENSELKTEIIWQEVLASGIVKDGTKYENAFHLKAPASYPLKKVGFEKEYTNFTKAISGYENLFYASVSATSKKEVYITIKNMVNELLVKSGRSTTV